MSVATVHAHVRALQERFLDGLAGASAVPGLDVDHLLPGRDVPDRGHFLTFRLADAAAVHGRLAEQRVVTDYRGDRFRIGFGLYHDPEDVDELLRRVAALGS